MNVIWYIRENGAIKHQHAYFRIHTSLERPAYCDSGQKPMLEQVGGAIASIYKVFYNVIYL